MHFNVTSEVTQKEEEAILNGLIAYNLARIEDTNPQPIGVFYENETGEKLAGLIGSTHGKWLEIKYLWVNESLRGQGIGSKLLAQAEVTSVERGCKYAFLDTFGFQAPDFYKKYQYKEVFVLEAYPCTGKRHYFTKEL